MPVKLLQFSGLFAVNSNATDGLVIRKDQIARFLGILVKLTNPEFGPGDNVPDYGTTREIGLYGIRQKELRAER